ncbi:hypothetical protein PPTG_00216 [Phytophthora nicotianae INRA-310]|uniref:ZSWIM1/3 RNaseH-like domain-containing protein n=1 Tax=Phytophthora nicotianae (strain INRA-310) TaxID=761204 RepID=W2RE47_PHYN3|nr:hypothetical protein PPTG_00216 [Phytophthora nicotianae INRA-310]ETN23667.1 hypothetical protein PPTG_00216 [Phytophthora nicotianae INRA-310]
MADQAREEEEARTAEAVRRASVEASRTRAEKSRAMKIGREEKEGVDVSTESGPNEATTADASTDIQHSDDGDEHEDEEDSASASEEEKDEVVHSGTRGDEATVPSFQTDHKTWALFDESLQEYMRTTKQVLVVRATVSAKRRNQDLRKQTRYQGLPDSQIPLVPEEMNPCQRRWCKQRGISLKREVYRHNHPISSDIYMSYPGIRQVSSRSPLIPGIELLVESDAKKSSIYDYIRRNSDHRVTMDDVRTRSPVWTLSDDDAVAETVVNFNLENPRNVSTVVQSARGDTGVISVTTAHMPAMYDNFPEVLQMDCTHKTNK